MAKSIYSTPVGEVYGESTALATTLAYGDILNVRRQFKGLQIWCASEIRFLATPRIAKVLLYDASEDTYFDLTDSVLDNDTSTHANLGTMTASDILYVGCVDTYLGLSVNVTSVNAVTATFTEQYWNGSAWTQLPDTISDGTISGGVTLAQDGLYTWGIPGAGVWDTISAYDLSDGAVPDASVYYYTRFYPSATLTAGTNITALVAINKGTNYIRWPAASPQEFNYDEGLVGGLQFLAASGTPTVYVNWIEYKG